MGVFEDVVAAGYVGDAASVVRLRLLVKGWTVEELEDVYATAGHPTRPEGDSSTIQVPGLDSAGQ